jgi:hypothetical protein
MITDGLFGMIEIRAGKMISYLWQVIVARRYLGRKNCFGHKPVRARPISTTFKPKAALVG